MGSARRGDSEPKHSDGNGFPKTSFECGLATGDRVTDTYANGLREDLARRQEWAQGAGLGFALIGLFGLQNVVNINKDRVA